MSRRSASPAVAAKHVSTRSRPAGTEVARPSAEPAASDEGDSDLDQPAPSLERLVAEAMSMAATTGVDGPELAELVNRFWRLVPDEELAGRTAAQMLAAAKAHLELAQQRLPGELKLEIEQSEDRTALLVVTDDMPFLVDSLTAAIAAADLEVRMLAHPLVVVRREALGALTQVRPVTEPDDAGPGEIVESWMRLEVARLRDEDAVTALRNDVQRVLTDVREAVEDWPRMRTQALALADELAAARLPVPDKDITDSVDLL